MRCAWDGHRVFEVSYDELFQHDAKAVEMCGDQLQESLQEIGRRSDEVAYEMFKEDLDAHSDTHLPLFETAKNDQAFKEFLEEEVNASSALTTPAESE